MLEYLLSKKDQEVTFLVGKTLSPKKGKEPIDKWTVFTAKIDDIFDKEDVHFIKVADSDVKLVNYYRNHIEIGSDEAKKDCLAAEFSDNSPIIEIPFDSIISAN